MANDQTVLITGASRGFGYLTALTLMKAGYKVVAAMRDPAGKNAEHARGLKEDGAIIVDMDVTDDKGVESAIAQAIKEAGKIDVVINNAGVGTMGWIDSFSIDDFKRVFDVNVFGPQRVNKAVLPHMKEHGGGTIIQISSLLGRFVIPFLGPYNATKHAVEALADNYRIEGAQFGIQSLIVEPGAFGTEFGTNVIPSSDKARTESYGALANEPYERMEGLDDMMHGPDAPQPQMVADAVLKLLQTAPEKRPFRTTVDGLGMDTPIEAINKVTDEATAKIYAQFGVNTELSRKKAA